MPRERTAAATRHDASGLLFSRNLCGRPAAQRELPGGKSRGDDAQRGKLRWVEYASCHSPSRRGRRFARRAGAQARSVARPQRFAMWCRCGLRCKWEPLDIGVDVGSQQVRCKRHHCAALRHAHAPRQAGECVIRPVGVCAAARPEPCQTGRWAARATTWPPSPSARESRGSCRPR